MKRLVTLAGMVAIAAAAAAAEPSGETAPGQTPTAGGEAVHGRKHEKNQVLGGATSPMGSGQITKMEGAGATNTPPPGPPHIMGAPGQPLGNIHKTIENQHVLRTGAGMPVTETPPAGEGTPKPKFTIQSGAGLITPGEMPGKVMGTKIPTHKAPMFTPAGEGSSETPAGSDFGKMKPVKTFPTGIGKPSLGITPISGAESTPTPVPSGKIKPVHPFPGGMIGTPEGAAKFTPISGLITPTPGFGGKHKPIGTIPGGIIKTPGAGITPTPEPGASPTPPIIGTMPGKFKTPIGGISTPVGGFKTPVGGFKTPVGGIGTPPIKITPPIGITPFPGKPGGGFPLPGGGGVATPTPAPTPGSTPVATPASATPTPVAFVPPDKWKPYPGWKPPSGWKPPHHWNPSGGWSVPPGFHPKPHDVPNLYRWGWSYVNGRGWVIPPGWEPPPDFYVPEGWYYFPHEAYHDYGFYNPSQIVIRTGHNVQFVVPIEPNRVYVPPPPPRELVSAPPPPERVLYGPPPQVVNQVTTVEQVDQILARKREPDQPRYAGPVLVTGAIQFDTAKYDIRPESFATLDAVGETLLKPPLDAAIINVEGHTDSVGSDESNQKLSEQRAWSVKSYLVQKFGIDPNRLIIVGYGERAPIASNDTDEGRQKNRRVEFENVTDLYNAQVQQAQSGDQQQSDQQPAADQSGQPQ